MRVGFDSRTLHRMHCPVRSRNNKEQTLIKVTSKTY